MAVLHIHDRRERALVAAADRMLGVASAIVRPFRRRVPPKGPRRILLLRLERIGDLVMALPAIREVRSLAPSARIHLAVGSWNLPLAAALPYVDRVEAVDAAWLARGEESGPPRPLLAAARRWRRERFDIAINFEPDVRSNLLLAAAGAAWTAGWVSGGGGPLLDLGLDYDTRAHTAENARRLVAAVFGRPPGPSTESLLAIPESSRGAARARLVQRRTGPLVGLHASAGRLVKQWAPDRFGDVARSLATDHDATIVLTGSAADRAMVDEVKARVPADHVVDLAGSLDLLELSAVLEQLDVLLTCDTGPMHVASAVGTPVVAVFGPSDPVRYAPSGPADRIVRVDLPCSPCNRIRQPPEPCVGHIPECLTSIPADRVYHAVLASLEYSRRRRRPANHATA